jgi:hypothetical protein
MRSAASPESAPYPFKPSATVTHFSLKDIDSVRCARQTIGGGCRASRARERAGSVLPSADSGTRETSAGGGCRWWCQHSVRPRRCRRGSDSHTFCDSQGIRVLAQAHGYAPSTEPSAGSAIRTCPASPHRLKPWVAGDLSEPGRGAGRSTYPGGRCLARVTVPRSIRRHRTARGHFIRHAG